MKKILMPFLLAGLAACGGGGPASPDRANDIPNVQGTYNGPMTWTIDGSRYPGTLSMRMVVAQAASQVTMNATMTIDGTTMAVPAISGTVSATGAVSATSGGTSSFSDPSCGLITGVATSLTFAGNNAIYVENDSTQRCGQWQFSATLTR
jgi:hypothetical protein